MVRCEVGMFPPRRASTLCGFSHAGCERQTFFALPLLGGSNSLDALTLVLVALGYSRACRSDCLFVSLRQRLASLGSPNLSLAAPISRSSFASGLPNARQADNIDAASVSSAVFPRRGRGGPISKGTHMKNSEQWLRLAIKVAQSYEDGTRSPRTDNIDRSIMAQCVKVLLAGRPLSQKQRDSFVESVRLRVGGQYLTREFPETAMLTARQRQTALKNDGNILTDLIACFPQAFDTDALACGTGRSNTRGIAGGTSSARDQDVHSSYPTRNADAASLLPSCGKWSGNFNGASSLAFSTERNLTERNDTERMAEMDLRSTRRSLGLAPRVPVVSPADEVALATPPEHPGSPAGSPVVSELRSAKDVAAHLSSRERRAAPSTAAAREPEAEHPQDATWPWFPGADCQFEESKAEPADKEHQEATWTGSGAEPARSFADEITPGIDAFNGLKLEASLWVNGGKLSGEIKANGETYHVNFLSYTRCEELMGRSHCASENPINHAWLTHHIWQNLGRGYRDRQSPIMGKADYAERFAVSGLYGNRRCEGRPVPRVMARACWEGEQLTAVEVYNGVELFRREMRPFRSNNPMAPAYKHA